MFYHNKNKFKKGHVLYDSIYIKWERRISGFWGLGVGEIIAVGCEVSF